MMEDPMGNAYRFNERSPVVVFKNGGFAPNLSNVKVAQKFIDKIMSCKDISIKPRKQDNSK